MYNPYDGGTRKFVSNYDLQMSMFDVMLLGEDIANAECVATGPDEGSCGG